MSRQGRVYVQNKRAGIIREIDTGYEFCYDPEYLSDEDAGASSIEENDAGGNLGK